MLPTAPPADEYPTRFAGEIKSFDSEGLIAKKMERRLDKAIKYTLVAGKKVLESYTHAFTVVPFVQHTCVLCAMGFVQYIISHAHTPFFRRATPPTPPLGTCRRRPPSGGPRPAGS